MYSVIAAAKRHLPLLQLEGSATRGAVLAQWRRAAGTSTVLPRATASTGTHSTFSAESQRMVAETFMPGFSSP